MTTNNALNIGLNGVTGTGNFVGSTLPNFTSCNIGQVTATNITFTSTTGIIGTTTNDNVTSGYVGEFMTANIPEDDPIIISPDLPTDLLTLILTRGDWDVWGNIGANPNGHLVVTELQYIKAGLSTSTGTLPADLSNMVIHTFIKIDPLNFVNADVPRIRLSLSNTTVVYLVALTTLAGGGSTVDMVIYGNIAARRVR